MSIIKEIFVTWPLLIMPKLTLYSNQQCQLSGWLFEITEYFSSEQFKDNIL